jgi:hypothetical protein
VPARAYWSARPSMSWPMSCSGAAQETVPTVRLVVLRLIHHFCSNGEGTAHHDHRRHRRPAGAAVTTVATNFAELSDGNWNVSAARAHPADITTSRRPPTAAEIDMWTKLNADQTIPHVDAMTINGPVTGAVWVSEKTLSRDLAAAIQLARAHLPIVAALPAPALYTSTDQIQRHLGYSGQATGPAHTARLPPRAGRTNSDRHI